MTLIENWQQSWKFTSVQAALILAVLNVVLMIFPALLDGLPIWLYSLVMVVGNTIVILLRLIVQPSLTSS